MPPKGKGKGKGKVQQQPEEVEIRESYPTPDSDDEGGSLYRNDKFHFSPSQENALVQWFSEHPEFNQKCNKRFADKMYKDRQLEEIAIKMNEPAEKIVGWFRNQRTAVGKLYKHKSGQATETLTSRKAWQLKAFAFLKEHISPRSYTAETTVIQSSERPASRASNEDSDDASINIIDDPSRSSSSVTEPRTSSLPMKKKARRVDEALIDYLSRPRPADSIAEQLKTLTPPQDEKTAFCHWFISRTMKVPDDRWEHFQIAAFDFLMSWTRSPISAPQNQHHTQNFRQPYQHDSIVDSYQPQHQSYGHSLTHQSPSIQPHNIIPTYSQLHQAPTPPMQNNSTTVPSTHSVYPAVSSSLLLGASQLTDFSMDMDHTSDGTEKSGVQN